MRGDDHEWRQRWQYKSLPAETGVYLDSKAWSLVTPQPHVLMFAHDGKGLGHLRRVCRVASALQGDCAVLVISGHRDLSWLLPEACEFVHLPSLDSLSHWKSRQWDRPPFWRDGQAKGRRLRMGIMEAVVNKYSPDAIVVDYLPMGQGGELYALIERRRQTKCRRHHTPLSLRPLGARSSH